MESFTFLYYLFEIQGGFYTYSTSPLRVDFKFSLATYD